jgi:hypothetical protein
LLRWSEFIVVASPVAQIGGHDDPKHDEHNMRQNERPDVNAKQREQNVDNDEPEKVQVNELPYSGYKSLDESPHEFIHRFPFQDPSILFRQQHARR